MSAILIDRPDTLAAFAAEAAQASWLAVDTEFMRERTYYPQLCLLQIATETRVACIDPIVLSNIGPILDVLFDPRVHKIFHAAGQDLEVLYHIAGRVPAPVFDTQIAAALAGHGDQCSYARLVHKLLGVELAKVHTRADWAKRPLSQAELNYAADDVVYLRAVYPRLLEDLRSRQRLAWLEDDFAALVDPERYRPDPHSAWRRVKGWMQLKPQQQQVLLRLANWRERRAMALDRPRRWILKDEVLLDLARRQPTSATQLARIRGLPAPVVESAGDKLLALIAAGMEAAPQALAPQPQRLKPQQEPAVDLLMAALRAIAYEHDLSPGMLASRRDLERLVLGERDLVLLSGWRGRLCGRALLDVLEGRVRLGLDHGWVSMTP